MSRRPQSLLLVVVGVVLLRVAASDLLLRFVRPGARPLVVAAAVVMVALGLLGGGRGSGRSMRLAWLGLAPVAAVLVIGPPALGAYTANRFSLAAVRPAGSPFGTLPRGSVAPMSLAEFALRALDRHGATLRGRTVAVTGFVLRPAPGGFVLARLLITCCAADAVPVTVQVRGASTGAGAAVGVGRWVRVTGRYTGQRGDEPGLLATAVVDVAAPADPYDTT